MKNWQKNSGRTWRNFYDLWVAYRINIYKVTRNFFDPNYALSKALEDIKAMRSMPFDKYQDVEEFLIGWKVGDTRFVSGSITTLVENNKRYCQFKTVIPPGKGFDEHWHDKVEDCRVDRGELKDETTGTFWRAGQVVRFDSMQKHIPVNPSSTVPCNLTVTFWKIEAPKLKT